MPATSMRLPDSGSGISGGWARGWACIFLLCVLACSPLLIFAAITDKFLLNEGTLLWRTLYWICSHTLTTRVTVRWFSIADRVWNRVRFCWPADHFSGDERMPAAITIDDSPGNDPDSFAEILRVLREAQVRATLFVSSSFVADDALSENGSSNGAYGAMAATDSDEGLRARMAALLRQAVEEGHELAHHMAEDRGYADMSAEDFAESVSTTEATLCSVPLGLDSATSGLLLVAASLTPTQSSHGIETTRSCSDSAHARRLRRQRAVFRRRPLLAAAFRLTHARHVRPARSARLPPLHGRPLLQRRVDRCPDAVPADDRLPHRLSAAPGEAL